MIIRIVNSNLQYIRLPWGKGGTAAVSQQEGPGFESESERFCVEFACSPCVCVGLFRALWFPPNVQKHIN